MKKVSIIIPLYNSEKYIAETIENALSQTWQNKEIIVVDDGSTDNSLPIVKCYKNDILKVFTKPNGGVTSARNFGLAYATGEYIQYIDADDLMDVDKIEKQMIFIEKNQCGVLDFVYSKYLIFKDNSDYHTTQYNTSMFGKSYDKPMEFFNDMWLENRYILPLTYLINKKLAEKAGPWNEQLINNNDGEYLSRIIAASEKVWYVSDTQVYYRATPNSLSTQTSVKYICCKYQSWTAIAAIMLKNNNSDRTRQAISHQFNEFITDYFPANKPYLKPLEKFMKQNKIPFETTGKSRTHKFVIKLFGWRKTFLLKKRIKKVIRQ